MDWMKIGSVVLLIGMAFFIWPRVRYAMQNTPKANSQDWMAFVIPIVGVIAFIALLMSLV